MQGSHFPSAAVEVLKFYLWAGYRISYSATPWPQPCWSSSAVIWMKVIQRLCFLRLWKSKVSKCVRKNWAWQFAYLSEKGKFWEDCQRSAPWIYFTWNKIQNTSDSSVLSQCHAAGSCLLLVGLECFSLPLRLVSSACTDSAGWSTHCSAPIFGVISWKMWVCPGTYIDWKSPTTQPGRGVKDRRMDYITKCVLKRENWDVLSSWEK